PASTTGSGPPVPAAQTSAPTCDRPLAFGSVASRSAPPVADTSRAAPRVPGRQRVMSPSAERSSTVGSAPLWVSSRVVTAAPSGAGPVLPFPSGAEVSVQLTIRHPGAPEQPPTGAVTAPSPAASAPNATVTGAPVPSCRRVRVSATGAGP